VEGRGEERGEEEGKERLMNSLDPKLFPEFVFLIYHLLNADSIIWMIKL
jgi:hypothetical protein